MKTLTATKQQGIDLNLDSFPNFHKSGSIIGMKKLYYGKDARLVRCGSYVYNVDFNTYNSVLIDNL